MSAGRINANVAALNALRQLQTENGSIVSATGTTTEEGHEAAMAVCSQLESALNRGKASRAPVYRREVRCRGCGRPYVSTTSGDETCFTCKQKIGES